MYDYDYTIMYLILSLLHFYMDMRVDYYDYCLACCNNKIIVYFCIYYDLCYNLRPPSDEVKHHLQTMIRKLIIFNILRKQIR